MTETSNLTSEQKEKNQKYIFNNLDKYIIDSRGNFVNIDSDLLGSENAELYFIGKEAVKNHAEIIKKFASMVLQNKEDWEVILDGGCYIKNKKDGRVIYEEGFGHIYDDPEEDFIDVGYDVIGELGYRECVWKDYEKNKKWKEDWLKQKKENEEIKRRLEEKRKKAEEEQKQQNQTPPSPKEPDNFHKPEQNNSSSNQERENNSPTEQNQDKPTNFLPPPTEIQNQYNSDKVKTEIVNNPNLIDNQEKQKAEELLKLIITAELLVKETKSNSEILTKLLNEKNQSSSIYQLLNKENRIDQVISQLQNIEKNNNSVTNNQNQQNKNPSSFKIIIPVGLSLLSIAGIAVLVKRKKKRNN